MLFKHVRKLTLPVAGLLAVLSVSAYAAGIWEGMTDATLPLTGAEHGAFDTGLSQGRSPQTEAITVDQLKQYMFGNNGTASTTANATATATAGAATSNNDRVVVTSEALTTAAAADYTLTLTNSEVLATSIVLVSVANGTNTTEGLSVQRVQPAAGSVVIKVRNTHASAALNGTIKISVAVIN